MRTTSPLLALVVIGSFALGACTTSSTPERAVDVKLGAAGGDVGVKLTELANRAPNHGFNRVRSYDRAVFMDTDDATIGFYPQDGAMVLHVALTTPYRLPKAQRERTLANLRSRAELLWNTTASERRSTSTLAWRDVQVPAG